jgi:hypothetical protein
VLFIFKIDTTILSNINFTAGAGQKAVVSPLVFLVAQLPDGLHRHAIFLGQKKRQKN